MKDLNVYCECCGTSGKVTFCDKLEKDTDMYVTNEALCDECIEIESEEYNIITL